MIPDQAAAPDAPLLALRVVTTYDDATRRFDLGITAGESVLVAHDGAAGQPGHGTTFPTERLWPVVRDLLPPLDLLRATPAGRAWPRPWTPPESFATDARAFVAVTTVTEDGVVVRSWLTTDDHLWSVGADPATSLLPAAPGAVADLLVWDVTAALERLARADDARRAS